MLHSIVRRTRQNHALEHATLHLMARRHPRRKAAGLSYAGGFTLITDLPPEEVYPLVDEALRRLKGGESVLRIHPNCGTNLITAALLVTAAAFASLRGWERARSTSSKLDLLARTLLAEMVALTLAAPLGLLVQARLTTEADLADLQVREMVSGRYGRVNLIHVRTERR